MKKETCYVCGHQITKELDCVRIGQGKFRHEGCKPGSSNWMATKGKDSQMARYYKPTGEKEESTKEPKHPQEKNIVAFVGRVNYLTFMHERDRKNTEYSGLYITIESPVIDAVAILNNDSILVKVGSQEVAYEPRKTLKTRVRKAL